MTDQFELICAAATGLTGDTRQIVAVPPGQVTTSDGDTYLLDREAADLTIARFQGHGVKLPVDIQHSTIHKGEVGEPDPAAGWVDNLAFNEQRGLLASVQWTEGGHKAIQAGQYKYVSPAIAIRKSDGRVVALHSIALTTKPAIPRMPELIAASESVASFLKALSQDPPPTGNDPYARAEPVGGGDGPGPSPGVQAAGNPKVRESVFALLAQARDLLGMASDVTPKGVVLELGAFVEAASAEQETDTAAMRERIRAEVTQERELEDLLVQYSRENKLHLGNESVMLAARTLAGRDLEAFKALMGSMPSKVPPGRTAPPTGQQVETQVVAREAAAEFQAHRAELSRWTDQDAFVKMRLREHAQKAS